jgi:hypothetical protein
VRMTSGMISSSFLAVSRARVRVMTNTLQESLEGRLVMTAND